MKIHYGGPIFLGLAIFLGLMTFPLWYNAGKAAYKQPDLVLPKNEKACIESKEFMREKHMQILNEWRDWALRDGERTYVNSQGKKFTISLQNTCMECHTSKKDFCDKCHTEAAVSPYCWDCHVAPEEVK